MVKKVSAEADFVTEPYVFNLPTDIVGCLSDFVADTSVSASSTFFETLLPRAFFLGILSTETKIEFQEAAGRLLKTLCK